MTGRPSAEDLCRQVISILDSGLPDAGTVHQLRRLFDIPDPEPIAKDARAWPVLRASEAPPHDARD